MVFWLKQAYYQPPTKYSLMEGKFSVGLFGPILISFNNNAVVRNLLFEVFERFATNLKGICKRSPWIIELQEYSDHSVTEPMN